MAKTVRRIVIDCSQEDHDNISKHWKFCFVCGEQLVYYKHLNECPKCHESIHVEWRYCGWCGEKLKQRKMKAKTWRETVMTFDQRRKVLRDNYGLVSSDLLDEILRGWVDRLLIEQAEIAFKAGMKKVVDLANELLLPFVYDGSPKRLKWQAFLKEL